MVEMGGDANVLHFYGDICLGQYATIYLKTNTLIKILIRVHEQAIQNKNFIFLLGLRNDLFLI